MSFNFGIPFIPFYIQELGVVEPDRIKLFAGILSTAPAITMAVMAPIWGMAADKWGKKLMLLRAMLFASMIIAGMGMVSNVNQLIALRLIQGVFTGTVTAANVLVASGTPSNRLSFALGFMSSSNFIGASIGPVIGGFLAEYTGYRTSFFIGGILMLLDFFVVLSLVREEKTVPQQQSDEKKAKLPFVSIITASIGAMLFILFIIRVTRSIFTPYLPLFIQEMRSEASGAARITGMVNGVTGLMTALSGLTLSRLGDKYDKIRLMRIFFTAGIISAVPLVFVGNLWLFTAVYGIFFYIIGGVEPVLISVTTENTPVERRGALFGIQGLVGSMGWIIAPIIGGMVSIRFSIRSILYLIPAILIPGLAAMFIAKNRTVDRTEEGSLFHDSSV